MVYHCYNQSINYEVLFRSDDNYYFFLEKLRKHLLPSAHILNYCLMPDHFHLMLQPTTFGCQDSRSSRYLKLTEEGVQAAFQQNLSHAFKTILSSYAQALNRQHRRRGSLFKAKTKGKPVYEEFSPAAIAQVQEVPLARLTPYLHTCFNYIHFNPVKAQLALHPEEWEFSSALDYTGLQDSRLCNFALAKKLLGIVRKV